MEYLCIPTPGSQSQEDYNSEAYQFLLVRLGVFVCFKVKNKKIAMYPYTWIKFKLSIIL